MERYFNDDQLDYMRDLAAHPDKVCPCGWFWKDECERNCMRPDLRRRAQERGAPIATPAERAEGDG